MVIGRDSACIVSQDAAIYVSSRDRCAVDSWVLMEVQISVQVLHPNILLFAPEIVNGLLADVSMISIDYLHLSWTVCASD